MTRRHGFTLIELMVAVAIIGVLAATAIPAFIKYTRKSKTAEARQMVRKIYDGARLYYFEPQYANATDMNALPPSFPLGFGTPTASTDCCAMAMGGTDERCEPEAALWEDFSWRAIHFSMPDPHYYEYEYQTPSVLPPRDEFHARARGDLDCDGQRSLFWMYGIIDPSLADGTVGTGLLRRVRELE
jgi:prepilin-type N-terminal cleavage/methylation domain-containing protein